MNDMLLREAMTLLRSARDSDDHKLCLLCSFEPLHFKSYLQAFLVERFPDAAPQLTSWGYDQLEVGLQESSHALRVHAFFFQAEDGIRDYKVTGVQTCALPISAASASSCPRCLQPASGSRTPSGCMVYWLPPQPSAYSASAPGNLASTSSMA